MTWTARSGSTEPTTRDPCRVEGTGVLPKEGLYDTFDRWDVEHTYANGVKLRSHGQDHGD